MNGDLYVCYLLPLILMWGERQHFVRKSKYLSGKSICCLFGFYYFSGQINQSIKQGYERKEDLGSSRRSGQLIGWMCAKAAGLCGEDFE